MRDASLCSQPICRQPSGSRGGGGGGGGPGEGEDDRPGTSSSKWWGSRGGGLTFDQRSMNS